MLIGFTFKNFMSFYDESTFSMRSSGDTKFRELNTFPTIAGDLTKSALIFGANASGKTNFIEAIACMKSIVLADLNLQSAMLADVLSFVYSDASKHMSSSFEVAFIAGGTQYEYGFEILAGEVQKEYLYRKDKRKTEMFRRTSPNFHDIKLSRHMDNVKDLVKNTRRNNLFLYWANGGNSELAMEVCHWFESIQIFDASDSNGLSVTVSYLEKNEDGKLDVLNLIQKADATIRDFNYEITEENEHNEIISKALKKSFANRIRPLKSVELKMTRPYYDENWKLAGDTIIDTRFESAGTKKLFEIAGHLVKALASGAVVFVDEIDAKLHPMLVRFLVMVFNSIDKNPNNAQLICNTHNALLLEEDIRRDQIYFVEKDEYGRSELYALTDFKGVRKDSKLLKQYLVGAFGATPKLQDYFPSKLSQEGACE